MFGSSANCFGSKTSDLDCCLTVNGIDNAVEAGFQSEKGEKEVTTIAALMASDPNYSECLVNTLDNDILPQITAFYY